MAALAYFHRPSQKANRKLAVDVQRNQQTSTTIIESSADHSYSATKPNPPGPYINISHGKHIYSFPTPTTSSSDLLARQPIPVRRNSVRSGSSHGTRKSSNTRNESQLSIPSSSKNQKGHARSYTVTEPLAKKSSTPRFRRWLSLGTLFSRKSANAAAPVLPIQAKQPIVVPSRQIVIPPTQPEPVHLILQPPVFLKRRKTLQKRKSQHFSPSDSADAIQFRQIRPLSRHVSKRKSRVRLSTYESSLRPVLPKENFLLNIDIPAVELERYSVMFKDVKPLRTRSSRSSLRNSAAFHTKPLPSPMPSVKSRKRGARSSPSNRGNTNSSDTSNKAKNEKALPNPPPSAPHPPAASLFGNLSTPGLAAQTVPHGIAQVKPTYQFHLTPNPPSPIVGEQWIHPMLSPAFEVDEDINSAINSPIPRPLFAQSIAPYSPKMNHSIDNLSIGRSVTSSSSPPTPPAAKSPHAAVRSSNSWDKAMSCKAVPDWEYVSVGKHFSSVDPFSLALFNSTIWDDQSPTASNKSTHSLTYQLPTSPVELDATPKIELSTEPPTQEEDEQGTKETQLTVPSLSELELSLLSPSEEVCEALQNATIVTAASKAVVARSVSLERTDSVSRLTIRPLQTKSRVRARSPTIVKSGSRRSRSGVSASRHRTSISRVSIVVVGSGGASTSSSSSTVESSPVSPASSGSMQSIDHNGNNPRTVRSVSVRRRNTSLRIVVPNEERKSVAAMVEEISAN